MLSKLQNMREEREQGFTLVELIIVVVIIAILAAVAIPMYLNFRKGAIDSTAQSDAVNAAKQVEAYYQSDPQGDLPDSLEIKRGDNPSTTQGLKDIKVSDGNTLTLEKGASGEVGDYTITVKNPNGKDSVAGIKYDSTHGGLQ